jgi:hypothetical protein
MQNKAYMKSSELSIFKSIVGLLKKPRLLRRSPLRGKLLAMTKDTFPCHCERFNESRGNLKRYDGIFNSPFVVCYAMPEIL